MMSLTKTQLKKIYTNLARADHFDRRMEARMLQGEMVGFYHAAKGSIAPGVGLCSLLNKDDNLSPHHRAHGIAHMLSKGIDIKPYIAEHSGKITGCCAGRSTYHFSFPDDKVYLMSAFIGYSPTLAVGWGAGALILLWVNRVLFGRCGIWRKDKEERNTPPWCIMCICFKVLKYTVIFCVF